MAIDYEIKQVEDFDKVTDEPRQIAGIFFYSQQDYLFDLAYKVACDAIDRPRYYPNADPDDIFALYTRYGSEEELASAPQRQRFYSALFGSESSTSNQKGDFFRLSVELMNASSAFAERAVDKSQDMLLEVVRSKLGLLHQHLSLRHGALAIYFKEVVLSTLANVCSGILHNPDVTQVFGVPGKLSDDWPWINDPTGSLLVGQISKQLLVPDDRRHNNGDEDEHQDSHSGVFITEDLHRTRHLIAIEGTKAYAAACDLDENASDDEIKQVAKRFYILHRAFEGLSGAGSPTHLVPYRPVIDGASPTGEGRPGNARIAVVGR